MLNAAPIRELSDELLSLLDVLIVNEHEASILVGGAEPEVAAAQLAVKVPAVVVTLGSDGLLVRVGDEPESVRILAQQVEAVDTTGAGDTFCGAFVAALDELELEPTDLDFTNAAVFASAAASISVQRPGAVSSIPLRSEIDAAL